MDDQAQRFRRLELLLGSDALNVLNHAHAMVIGVGGVGSWAAEALARSGVGKITLVDDDTVCPTNFNRQLQAVEDAIGQTKATVLAQRLLTINPELEVIAETKRYNRESYNEILACDPDCVIDAIDSIPEKCHLLATCLERGIKVISSTGAGGRINPAMVTSSDLAHTYMDPLASVLRKELRRKYNFPDNGKFGITAVFSTEPPAPPQENIRGTSICVTGTFGFHCAACAINTLCAKAQQLD